MKKEKTYLDRMKRLGPEKRWSFAYLLYDLGRLFMVPFYHLWYRPVILYENEDARKPVQGGAIVIANHQSYKDPPLLGCCVFPGRRIRFIALHSFFERPFTRVLFPQLLVIPINRDNTSPATLREIIRSLKNHWFVAIYPEGHVNWDSGLTSFKRGIAVFAASAKCPVIPVYIRKRKHIRERLICAVGAPVDYEEFSARQKESRAPGSAPALSEKEIQALFCSRLLEKEKMLESKCARYYEKN